MLQHYRPISALSRLSKHSSQLRSSSCMLADSQHSRCTWLGLPPPEGAPASGHVPHPTCLMSGPLSDLKSHPQKRPCSRPRFSSHMPDGRDTLTEPYWNIVIILTHGPASCAGGGVALLYASRGLEGLKEKLTNFDQQVGVQIVQNALKVPLKTIADNAGKCPPGPTSRFQGLGFRVDPRNGGPMGQACAEAACPASCPIQLLRQHLQCSPGGSMFCKHAAQCLHARAEACARLGMLGVEPRFACCAPAGVHRPRQLGQLPCRVQCSWAMITAFSI